MSAAAPEAFRAEVRAWIAENLPASMATPMPENESPWGGRGASWPNPDSRLWLECMAAKGWTAPTWPKAYGGGGLSARENLILGDELARAGARQALYSFGVWMLGPVLLEFASEEQKRTHIPPIVRGQIRWCQGYSEPGAGSDLASLRTRAEADGGDYVINGQKIWTSYADQADWMFCLVRTDASRKHEGISFILFDMKSPGVEVKPIRLISGSSPFCETFLTDVRVPKANLVGGEGNGWTIAKRLLQHERSMISNMGSGAAAPSLGGLEDAARTYGGAGAKDSRIADPSARDAVARHNMDQHAFMLALRCAAEGASESGGGGALTSVFKYYGAELNKRRYELLLKLMGFHALGWKGKPFTRDELIATRSWLRSKGNSIEGGTSEVQLNVIAKRVLELPSG